MSTFTIHELLALAEQGAPLTDEECAIIDAYFEEEKRKAGEPKNSNDNRETK